MIPGPPAISFDRRDTLESPNDSSAKLFVTTQWSMIWRARDASQPLARENLEQLCNVYWRPLFVFLRRQGLSPHDAEDLVQGFFSRFLEGDFLENVDDSRGRFRSFLLASLKHFSANQRRFYNAYRRGGSFQRVAENLTDLEAEQLLEFTHTSCPELAYDRAWALTVVEQATAQLREEHLRARKSCLFEAFHPWLTAEPDPDDYARAVREFDITPNALAVALHRFRKRFRVLLHREVARTLAIRSSSEVDDEVKHLLRVLITLCP